MTITVQKTDSSVTITPEQGGSGVSVNAAPSVVEAAVTVSRGVSGPEVVVASEALGGDRAITANGLHCDGGSAASLAQYAGITLTSASVGANVSVKRTGPHTIVGAAFAVNQPVYIGPNGTLTQVIPSFPIRRIGWASTTNTINLDPFPIIGA